jgi:predicted metalloprotease
MSGTSETTAEPAAERPQSRRRVVATLLVLAALAASGSLAWRWYGDRAGIVPLPPLSRERAAVIGRRVGVVFDDAERSWAQWFRARGLAAPAPARLVLYSLARPSPCLAAAPATGPFYCPIDATASFDLAFLNALEEQMRREGELGTALVVARVMAEHIQATLGAPDAAAGSGDAAFNRAHALQADCLAGVWAGMAADRLGAVPPGLYARVMDRGNGVNLEHVTGGRPEQPALDIFLYSDDEAREQAFRRGLAASGPEACPGPR